MRIGTAFLCLSCSAATVAAQEKKQSVEIGTSLGVTVLSPSSETFTTVGAPVAQGPVPLFGQATLYATIFATPSVMIEPQLSFSHLSGGGSSLTLIGGAANIGYLFTATERASPYVAASLGSRACRAIWGRRRVSASAAASATGCVPVPALPCGSRAATGTGWVTSTV